MKGQLKENQIVPHYDSERPDIELCMSESTVSKGWKLLPYSLWSRKEPPKDCHINRLLEKNLIRVQSLQLFRSLVGQRKKLDYL